MILPLLGVRLNRGCDQLKAWQSTSYLSSAQSAAKICTQNEGNFDQEFNVRAEKGQQVQVSLIDLSFMVKDYTEEAEVEVGEEVGFVLDPETEEVKAVQRSGKKKETDLMLTKKHAADIGLSSAPRSSFIVTFKGD